jgi:CheY-like chemotaxis protein/HPt (histidine-containing phosphotransfer) domain-containing protein
MLLRLSRTSFWLAAAVAALALLAPAGHETLLMVVTGVASLLALGLWRSALRNELRRPAAALLSTPAPMLDRSVLRDAAAQIVSATHDAPSFEPALHAVARVLRSELGARAVAVHEVHDVNTTHARISDLIESQPGFRTVPRRLRLDTAPLARALREGRPAGSPPDAVALPVVADGRVLAAIELSAIDLPIDPEALAGLLELAGTALAARAPAVVPPAGADAAAAVQRANVLVIAHNFTQAEAMAALLRHTGCHATLASGMLEGLAAAHGTQFDLVLIDLPLAAVEASEEWRRLRRDAFDAGHAVWARDTPMIAVSAADAPGDGDRFRELGFDDHLSKPIRPGQLLAMLSKHLHPHAPAEAESVPAGAAPAVLDPVALARLGDLDPNGANRLLERVLRAFETSVARLRPQLDAARAGDDRAAIRLVAHTLKSSSASIGAMQLSQLCAQVEAAIRLDTGESLVPQLDALDAALGGALQAIAALLKERE